MNKDRIKTRILLGCILIDLIMLGNYGIAIQYPQSLGNMMQVAPKPQSDQMGALENDTKTLILAHFDNCLDPSNTGVEPTSSGTIFTAESLTGTASLVMNDSDYVEWHLSQIYIPDPFLNNNLTEGTFECYFRPTEIVDGTIILGAVWYSSLFAFVRFWYGKLYAGINDGIEWGNYLYGTSDIIVGVNYHVMLSFGPHGRYLYLNDSLEASDPAATKSLCNGVNEFGVGQIYTYDAVGAAPGIYDEFRVSNIQRYYKVTEPMDLNSDNMPDGWSVYPSYPPESFSMANMDYHATCLQVTDQAGMGIIQKEVPNAYSPDYFYWCSYWIKITESAVNCFGGLYLTGLNGTFGLYIQNGFHLKYFNGSNQSSSIDTGYDVTLDQWYHLTCLYWYPGNFQAYLNQKNIVAVSAFGIIPKSMLIITHFQTIYIDEIYCGNSSSDAWKSYWDFHDYSYSWTNESTTTETTSSQTTTSQTTTPQTSHPEYTPQENWVGIFLGVAILAVVVGAVAFKLYSPPPPQADNLSVPPITKSTLSLSSTEHRDTSTQSPIIQDSSIKPGAVCPICGSPILRPKAAYCEMCGFLLPPR